MTENLQQKAEEQADKVSKNARPYADQASGAIEGGAKRVAEGAHPASALPWSATIRDVGPFPWPQPACSPLAFFWVHLKAGS